MNIDFKHVVEILDWGKKNLIEAAENAGVAAVGEGTSLRKWN